MKMGDDVVGGPALELRFARPITPSKGVEKGEEGVAFVAEVQRLVEHTRNRSCTPVAASTPLSGHIAHRVKHVVRSMVVDWIYSHPTWLWGSIVMLLFSGAACVELLIFQWAVHVEL